MRNTMPPPDLEQSQETKPSLSTTVKRPRLRRSGRPRTTVISTIDPASGVPPYRAEDDPELSVIERYYPDSALSFFRKRHLAILNSSTGIPLDAPASTSATQQACSKADASASPVDNPSGVVVKTQPMPISPPRHPSPGPGTPNLPAQPAPGAQSKPSVTAKSPEHTASEDKPIESSSRTQEIQETCDAHGKKRRLSTATAPPAPAKRHRDADARRRHPDFWALDGSIVLQLENIIFRLHRSELVRHSKYFADLLARPPQDVDDSVDGYPVYRVPGKAKDFEHLWHAVEDAISYVHAPPAFPILASILRAATTYDFPAFRTWAVKTFADMWPLDIASVTAAHRSHAVQSIVLARACGVPTVLRHAFYELSRHPSFDLKEDENKNNNGDNEVDNTLSRADLTRLIMLRECLQSALIAVVPMLFASCGKNDCALSPVWASTSIGSPKVLGGLVYDPLNALQLFVRFLHTEPSGLCEACVGKARAACEQTRVNIWEEKLDVWLGLV